MPDIFIGILESDDIPPVVDSLFPVPFSTGVQTDTVISLAVRDFGAGVDPLSINITVNSVPAIANGVFVTGYSGTILPITNGYSIVITPDDELPYNSGITVDYYVQDLATIFNSTSGSWSFTSEQDLTGPVFSDIHPANGSLGIAVNSPITFHITDPETSILLSSVNVAVEGLPAVSAGNIQPGYSGTIVPISGGFVVSLTRSAPFASLQEVNISAIASNDTVPSIVSSADWSFQCADVAAPDIQIISPTSGQSSVARNANIVFRVEDDAGVELHSLFAYVNGTEAISSGIFVSGYSGTITPSLDGKSVDVSIDPDVDFSSYEHVNVDIFAHDVSDNSATIAWDFFVEDDTAPAIIIQSPIDGAIDIPRNTVIFFEVIDEDSGINLSSISVEINGSSAIVGGVYQAGYSGSIDLIEGGYEVHIHPDVIFSHYETVSITAEVSDISGNISSLSWSFRTLDGLAPSVFDLVPANGTSSVAVDTAISFKITDVGSGLDLSSLQLNIAGTAAIVNGIQQPGFAFSTSPIPSGLLFVVNPDADFTGTTSVSINLAVRDITGNESTASWEFVTANLISYIMRAYRQLTPGMVHWSSPVPVNSEDYAPYPASELQDTVITSIVNGGLAVYNMRGFHTVSSQYVYWTVEGQPDIAGDQAPVPLSELADIIVIS